ncbi:MAG: sigma-70 family RNA polymerase sigma factor [Hyphomonadaceae bacterium]
MSDLEPRLKALMLRGLAGDAAAHAELLGMMAKYLRGFLARKMGRNAADLEDLVQESLLAIHLKRDTYDTSQPFTAWAFTIARYKLIDWYRRNRIRRTESLDEAAELFGADDTEEVATRRDLGKLVSTLPEKQRTLLEDVKITGLSNAEAAKKAGMTEGAVKVSVHRSLQALMRRARDED